MRPHSLWIAAVLLLASQSFAKADGLIKTLPPDGTWTTFFIDVEVNETLNVSGDVHLRSVGEQSVNGQPHRWMEIEIKIEDNAGNTPVHNIYKALIPESKLEWGEAPIDFMEQLIVKIGDADPMQPDIDDYKKKLEAPAIFLGGPLKNVKPLPDDRDVNYQKGQLTCKGIVGDFKFDGLPNQTIDFKQKVWFNEKLPYGIAAREAHIIITDKNGNKQTLKSKLTVNDFGKDAKSGIE